MADVEFPDNPPIVAIADNDIFPFRDTSTGLDSYVTGVNLMKKAHPHDGETLQIDGINSNGGVFSFTTTGKVTFNQLIDFGGQLSFPAGAVPSADPNTLDDYEEGSFTPGMFDASGGGNEATYTAQAGKFVKIGKCVHFIIAMEIAGIGGMTGANDAFFRDLPFVVGTISGALDQVAPVFLYNVTFNGTPVVEMQSTASYFKIAEVTSGAVVDYVTVAEFGTGRMYVTGTYFV